MSDKPQQKQRTNRVFKSLHKPLTYLGVERTLFYFVCVGAVGAFNLFNSRASCWFHIHLLAFMAAGELIGIMCGAPQSGQTSRTAVNLQTL
jgi:hypothetical protein